MDPVPLSFSAALLLGLGFGSGPCNIACLPYLGPVFLAKDDGVRHAWRTIVPFSLGRMSGYAMLGLLAGWAGLLVRQWLDGDWVRWVLGGATIFVATAILWRRTLTVQCASAAGGEVSVALQPPRRDAAFLPGSLYVMGMGMALNPCAPLTTIILAAAATASATAGLSLGVGFGLGAALVPALIFGIGVAHFSDQVRAHLQRWRIPLENASVGLLYLMGIGTMAGWIAP